MTPRWARRLLDLMDEDLRVRRKELRAWRAEMREEHRLRGEELRAHQDELRNLGVEQKRRFDKIDAAIENDKQVTRQIVLQLEAARDRDRDLHDQMRAMTQGLLRVIDRLDRNDGPSAAGA